MLHAPYAAPSGAELHPHTQVVTVPRHKKYAPAGKKSQLRLNKIWLDQADALEVKEGEEVTLMEWGNCIIKKVHKNSAGAVTAIDADLHLAGDFKTTRLKLTWLAQVGAGGVAEWGLGGSVPAVGRKSKSVPTLYLVLKLLNLLRWMSLSSCSCRTSTT